MYYRNKKRITIVLLCCVLLIVGCAGNDKEKQEKISSDKEAVHIPVIFLADPSSQIMQNKKMVEKFNETYKNEYVVDIQWLTDSIENYRKNLKKWNVLGQLPAVITDVALDKEFYHMLIEEDRLVDMNSYMNEEWKDKIDEIMLESCREDNGELYMIPSNYLSQGCAGIIYNEQLLKEAGYEEFPDTWDGFWQCMEALKDQGITPLSLHADTYWVPMLIAGSYSYGTEEGRRFMKTDFPESYQNEGMYQILSCMTRLFDYSYPDALELEYGDAANRFINGEAAVIANGFWMVEELLEKNIEGMKFAPFPGNVLMNSPEMSGWAVVSGYDEDVIEGAVKFLEFRTQYERSKMSESVRQNTLYYSYAETVANVENIMPNYQLQWEKKIQDDYIPEKLQDVMEENVSIEEFLSETDKYLNIIREEK